MEKRKNLLMIITGSGKGKSTSALGQALRMAGHGRKVALVQCIKHRVCGEHKALERFSELIDVHLMGQGFTWTRTQPEHDQALAKAWERIQEILADPSYSLVILDEFTYPLHREQVDLNTFLSILDKRPSGMHVLVTGRNAPQALCQAADLVSIIADEKHPYAQGIPSQQGIEY